MQIKVSILCTKCTHTHTHSALDLLLYAFTIQAINVILMMLPVFCMSSSLSIDTYCVGIFCIWLDFDLFDSHPEKKQRKYICSLFFFCSLLMMSWKTIKYEIKFSTLLQIYCTVKTSACWHIKEINSFQRKFNQHKHEQG